jgi:hypothetical protein
VTNTGVFTQYDWSNENGYANPTETTVTINNWNTTGYIFFKTSYNSVTEAITAEDYLFIPAAGYCTENNTFYVGDNGCIWSSTLFRNDKSAWHINVSTEIAGFNYYVRCYGLSVRGVVGQMAER